MAKDDKKKRQEEEKQRQEQLREIQEQEKRVNDWIDELTRLHADLELHYELQTASYAKESRNAHSYAALGNFPKAWQHLRMALDHLIKAAEAEERKISHRQNVKALKRTLNILRAKRRDI